MNTERPASTGLVTAVVGYSAYGKRFCTYWAYAECKKILKTCLNKYKGSIFNTAGLSSLGKNVEVCSF